MSDNEKANDTVGEHDRVTMLTLNPNGSIRGNDPELIGDKETVLALTKEQFAQQAVSAKDQELRGKNVFGEELRKAHEAARDGAHKAAEAIVNKLHRGEEDKDDEAAEKAPAPTGGAHAAPPSTFGTGSTSAAP